MFLIVHFIWSLLAAAKLAYILQHAYQTNSSLQHKSFVYRLVLDVLKTPVRDERQFLSSSENDYSFLAKQIF